MVLIQCSVSCQIVHQNFNHGFFKFCHYSPDPSGAFKTKSIKNYSNEYLCVNQVSFFRRLLFLDFVLYCPYLEAHCLRFFVA
jgi:hypothetical protein